MLTLHSDTCALRMAQVRSKKITRLQERDPAYTHQSSATVAQVGKSSLELAMDRRGVFPFQSASALQRPGMG